ncbi:MAG TPA: hypothetical protein GXX39_07605 [Syntrophothermus lipocalidus]|nr:hypothetical protein [Syntrophothermus lipocalidus]
MVLLFVWWPAGLAGLAVFAVWAVRSLNAPAAEARAWYLKGREAMDKGEWQQALEAFLKR